MMVELPSPIWRCGVTLLAITLLVILPNAHGEDGEYLNQFAIQLTSGGRDIAEDIARQHGFIVKRELPNVNAFVLEHPNVNHRSKRSAENELEFLKQDKRVRHAQQEITLKRVKRAMVYDKQLELPIRTIGDDSVFARFKPPNLTQRDNVYGVSVKFEDPKFKDMWYLINQGQSGGEEGLDLNVAVAWENGFTGKGVVVCILDDGVDHRHPDLRENYDPEASTDLNDKSDNKEDPMPDTSNEDNSHGTRCAGEIAAAANNDVCGVGVAYNARIGGVRMLDGKVTDALEAEAIGFNNQYIDIYSSSWGPSDDGGTMEGPKHLALEALQEGVRNGRKGLGSIFVWATGNGGMNQDDCSADGYVSRPETLSVGSVNDWGNSPFFMEKCPSTFAVVPSGGEDYRGQEEETGKVKLKVITTDMNGGCIENFQGTSSAAPLAAGCLATVVQANPNLTWRDVQHIVVRGTRVPSADESWTINGAGYHVSHRFGFGMMDCGKMVQLAQSWITVPDQRICNNTKTNYQTLTKNGMIVDTMDIDGCATSKSQAIDRLEHVQLYVKMSSQRRGDIKISITSPAGTKSNLLSPRPKDDFEGAWQFAFMTVHSWGETPQGKWTLEIHHKPTENGDDSDSSHSSSSSDDFIDKLKGWDRLKYTEDDEKSPVGFIKEWNLVLYGTHGTRHDRTGLYADKEQKAYYPSENDVKEIKKREFELSRKVNVKRAEVSLNTEKEKRMPEKKDEVDQLTETLWNLLHSHGGREVKKRVFKDPGSSEMTRKDLRLKRINKLTSEITDLLQIRDEEISQRQRRKELQQQRTLERKELVRKLSDYLYDRSNNW